MASEKHSKKNIQRIFAAVFLLSTLIYFTAPLLFGGQQSHQPSIPPNKGVQIVEMVSLLTSIVSMISLLSTMVISIVREKREQEKTALNQRLQEIQLSREKIALAQDKVALEKMRAPTDK
jgi:cell division protein FtsB